ncbi:hypothetical protein EI42_05754 [Thermosporothrix hazakensis]|jgi:predicted transcriptional regulator|uniref:Helix-turn-helix protein n=1 Tax=Thermosporothrix hazakensis TaxID=644383 RepID=A0A326TX18_THEHA|nr:hypothetical protein [Thermosporothrix hazakensis]PZW20993.1 hypothetical protein EI42_05754 [Thermosporothrix hazakensis]GCE49276.1 hypothetical protein KTH_41450 [Thermosporothrix hazakensis]
MVAQNTSASNNPKQQWGFYAVIPRIIRLRYKHLPFAALWLYQCLKDLCGDQGTCFRTLRTLSQETNISTGTLSTMIRRLHDEGLIHATKKRRGSAGRELWHLSIVDIWAANAEACQQEQQAKESISPEIVQNLNEVPQDCSKFERSPEIVQNLNDTPPDCSKFERDCSKFDVRRKNNEERTVMKKESVAGNLENASGDQEHTHGFSSGAENSPAVNQEQQQQQVYQAIVTRRGYELTSKQEQQRERACVVQLLKQWTPEEIDQLHAYLFEKHKYWSDPERRYAIGAAVILKFGPEVAQVLRASKPPRQQTAKQNPAAFLTPTMIRNRELAARFQNKQRKEQ